MAPVEGKTANTPRLGPVSTSRQRIAELARQALGMAVAIAWLPGPAGTRRPRSEAVCRGAGCGRTRTSGICGGPGSATTLVYPTCVRHGAQRPVWRCQPEGESRPGSDLRVQVPWRALMTGTPSRTARVPIVRWDLKEAEGKILTRGTRIACEASCRGARKRRCPKPSVIRNGPVYMRRAWKEGHASYPGRSACLPRASVLSSK